jgi:putative ABC transport system permease protein
MKLWDCLTTALHALLGNKLRSTLTMLGILIGVAAVISVISLGRIQQERQREAFASLGSNLIQVVPTSLVMGAMDSTPTLTLEDAEAIARDAHSVAMVAPVVQVMAQVKSPGEKVDVAMIAGVTPEYQWVNNLAVARGSFITNRDYTGRSRVVVLGRHIAETLFGSMDPVEQAVRIDGRQFKVMGVLESKGSAFGIEDLMVYAPLSTVQSTLASQQVSGVGHSVQAITVQAISSEAIDSAREEITDILRQRHHLREEEKENFTIISMEAVSGIAEQMLGIVQLILGAIAGISLVVGGIGIMNIMLVSVTERTREIGLRKAIGAKRRDILAQFLTEAATLSFCGGAVGVGLGWLIVKIISIISASVGFPFPAMIPGDVIALAVGVSVSIGLVSGLYPAIRAARLDPIESLRHE